MRFAAAFFLILFGISSGHACFGAPDFVFDDIRHADIVFRGRVTAYRTLRSRTEYKAVIEFAVDEVYKGKPATTLTADWFNSTYRLPYSLDNGPIIAAVVAAEAEMSGKGDEERLRILQAPCSHPFLLKHTPQLETRTRIALSKLGPENSARAQRLFSEYFKVDWSIAGNSDLTLPVRSEYSRLDGNGDAILSAEDAERSGAQLLQMARDQHRHELVEAIRRSDRDGDGGITLSEAGSIEGLLPWYSLEAAEMTVGQLFRSIDVDNNAIVTSSEIDDMPDFPLPDYLVGEQEQRLRELPVVIRFFDKDGDEALTLGELLDRQNGLIALYD